MVKNNSFFYLSGLISLFLFIFFLFSFGYMLFKSNKIKSYALKKDEYISISVDIIEPKKENKENIIKDKNLQKTSKSNSLATVSKTKHKDVDISDLFSNVWTKKVKIDNTKPKVKSLDKRRILEITKELKVQKKDTDKKISKSIKNLVTAKSSKKVKKVSSSAVEVNEYLAKINALVYKYFNPPQNSQGHSVKAVIELSPIGKVLDFRILNYSSNELLNRECNKLKARLSDVIFPVNPQNRSSRTIVILTAKE